MYPDQISRDRPNVFRSVFQNPVTYSYVCKMYTSYATLKLNCMVRGPYSNSPNFISPKVV